jgi:nucleotide-binding universal stress UspA family protein
MINQILLAVDDSADSFAAASIAIELAKVLGGHLRAVHVTADHILDRALEAASSQPGAALRRADSATTVLTRVAALAATAGVPVETSLLSGDIGQTVLDTARECRADLIVVGRSSHRISGESYVGPQTRHILEFAEQPVLVVAPPRL